jgi:hypothetical protein
MLSNWINHHEDDEDTATHERVAPLVSGKYFDEDEKAALYVPGTEFPRHASIHQGVIFFKKGVPAPYRSHADFPAVAQWSDPYSKGYYLGAGRVSFDPDPYSNQKTSHDWVCFVDTGTRLADPVQPSSSALQEPSPCGVLTTDVGLAQLQARVRFLEAQLGTDRPYLQLYKLGGVSLLVAVISLIGWAITGIGVPFHPVFAAMVIPVAVGVLAMAFFLRGGNSQSGAPKR